MLPQNFEISMIKKYDVSAFQNRVDCFHTTSRSFFSFIWNLIIFVQIMCQICQPWKKGKYHWFLQVCKKWSRSRMKTVDTVLESWDIILFDHRNFEIFGYHEVILRTKKVICGFSKNWRFWLVSCACRSSGWYPSGTQDLQIKKYDV